MDRVVGNGRGDRNGGGSVIIRGERAIRACELKKITPGMH